MLPAARNSTRSCTGASIRAITPSDRHLRGLPLIERKRILRRLVPPQPSHVLNVGHIDGQGVDLFQGVCQQDMEGIVAKLRDGTYDRDAPT